MHYILRETVSTMNWLTLATGMGSFELEAEQRVRHASVCSGLSLNRNCLLTGIGVMSAKITRCTNCSPSLSWNGCRSKAAGHWMSYETSERALPVGECLSGDKEDIAQVSHWKWPQLLTRPAWLLRGQWPHQGEWRRGAQQKGSALGGAARTTGCVHTLRRRSPTRDNGRHHHWVWRAQDTCTCHEVREQNQNCS